MLNEVSQRKTNTKSFHLLWNLKKKAAQNKFIDIENKHKVGRVMGAWMKKMKGSKSHKLPVIK